MINKRLLTTVEGSKKYIAAHVLLQWLSLVSNIVLMVSITAFLASLFEGDLHTRQWQITLLIAILALAIRYVCTLGMSRMGFLTSKSVKKNLRERIYEKLLRLGVSYNKYIKSSEVVQVAVEGVEQLETYFGAFLPQLFYAMLAPMTLFVVLSFVNFSSALVLFVCVPLIPIAIAAVQTWAKKLFAKYWGQYTTMGDIFLENLQGLTTLKIYQSDAFKHQEMNQTAENFRKITMRVLMMQLNSIIVMDLIAYGGAALGIILAVSQFSKNQVSLAGCLLIILLSAEFFLPMRQLGSFFHIAMNGMAASEKIFKLLDIPEDTPKMAQCPQDMTISFQGVTFAYEPERQLLNDLNLYFPQGRFSALVGDSGCGKSTIAKLLMGKLDDYSGRIQIGGIELRTIQEQSLMQNMVYVGHNSYLFKGTVRENLLIAMDTAKEEDLWAVLERVRLADFLRNEKGLDTVLLENASNFSGGQRQRLALARALLHDAQVFIFDEATSNIDVESESDIMREILQLAKTKTVLLISHRLANVVEADMIYVLKEGNVVESGKHGELLQQKGLYEKLWSTQKNLEDYGKDGVQA